MFSVFVLLLILSWSAERFPLVCQIGRFSKSCLTKTARSVSLFNTSIAIKTQVLRILCLGIR